MVGKVPLLRGSMANAMTQFFTLFLLYSPLHCKYRKTNKKRHREERAVQCPLLAKASGKVLLAAAGIIYIEKRRRRRVILLVPVYIKGMSEWWSVLASHRDSRRCYLYVPWSRKEGRAAKKKKNGSERESWDIIWEKKGSLYMIPILILFSRFSSSLYFLRTRFLYAI